MPRSIAYPAALPYPQLVRVLTWGKLTACLALAGSLTQATPVLAQATPPPSTGVDLNATPTLVNGRISRPTLQPGSQGESVRELQSVLTLLGYYSGPISGVYQDTTLTAVQQFQTAAGLNADGIVGPATWSSLFPAPPAEANPPGTTPAATTGSTGATAGTPATPASTNLPAPEATATPAPEPAASTSSPALSQPVLRLGDRGDAVRRLQERLKSLGFYSGPLDGIFGTQTEAAVKQAQSANNLTVDGIVGPATWNALK